MSLLDAFLLEPVRINLGFAERADGIKGSGTQSDPYNSLAFDEIMAGLPASPPIRVHLGPGPEMTVQRAVLDGLRQMFRPNTFLAGPIGEGAGHLQDPVIGTRA